MIYIYKKVISGKHYYYLHISKLVKGKKITKDIAYLGSDISKVQEKLSKLPPEHSADIRRTYQNINKYITSDYLLEKIKQQKLKKGEFVGAEFPTFGKTTIFGESLYANQPLQLGETDSGI